MALSRYEIELGRPAARRPVLPAERLARSVAHVWTTFQHARCPQVIDLVPGLLVDAERTHAHDPEAGRVPLVEAYRVTAALLVKFGAPDVAWLADDRAMIAATRDRLSVAAAAVQLGQVLRASGRARVAKSVMLAAAYRIAPPVVEYGGPSELSLCRALLVQAALAAAVDGDDAAVAELLDEAGDMAAQVGEGHDHHRTGFGPTAVVLARVAAAVELGDAREAVVWHEKATRRDGWRWLTAEHRAGRDPPPTGGPGRARPGRPRTGGPGGPRPPRRRPRGGLRMTASFLSLAQIRNRLVLTARTVLRFHRPGPDGRCPVCRVPVCPVATAARAVLRAAEDGRRRR